MKFFSIFLLVWATFINCITFFSFSIIAIRADEIWADNIPNSIRFYERQFYKGNYWTFDENGNWTSSRKTRMKDPYRNFHPRSIRTFCKGSCHWKICPMRRRNFRKLKRKLRCKKLKSNTEIESLRSWGWSDEALGYAANFSEKRKVIKKIKRKKKTDKNIRQSTTSLPPIDVLSAKDNSSLTDVTMLSNSSIDLNDDFITNITVYKGNFLIMLSGQDKVYH